MVYLQKEFLARNFFIKLRSIMHWEKSRIKMTQPGNVPEENRLHDILMATWVKKKNITWANHEDDSTNYDDEKYKLPSCISVKILVLTVGGFSCQ